LLIFSCIGVAWSALYSDTTRDHRKRVKGIKFAQLASLCSVNVITIIEKVSGSLEVFFYKNITTLYIAILGCIDPILLWLLTSSNKSLGFSLLTLHIIGF